MRWKNLRAKKIILAVLVVILLVTMGIFWKVKSDYDKTADNSASSTTKSLGTSPNSKSGTTATKASGSPSTTSSSSAAAPYTYSDVPTLFVHGYSGTVGSFSGMLQRLKQKQAGSLVMTLTVAADGTVAQTGTLDDHNPFIQVIFTANMDNEWNQATWLKNCLTLLKNQGVEQVNLLGHSMGGVDIIRYLFTTAQDSTVPTVNKIVTIGAPFNEFEILNEGETLDTVLVNGPQNKSTRFTEFSAKLSALAPRLPWLNIAGVIDESAPSAGDGTVPLPSALSLTATAKSLGLTYQNKIVTGDKAAHSQLHENTEVDAEVAQFLWEN